MKVFSLKKYCEDMGWAPSDFEQEAWQVKSNGKTKEEMHKMGYDTDEAWMVEEPSMLVFSEELYKKYVGNDRPLTSDDWAYGLDGRSKEDIESSTCYEIEDEWCYVKTPVEKYCEEVQAPKSKMTEREICERIVTKGDCAGISCSGDIGQGMNTDTPCPLYEKGRYYCCYGGANAKIQARLWLDEHPVIQEGSILEEEVPVEEAWKPKYGERVIVSDYENFIYKAERIYVAQDGDKHVCFQKDSEDNIRTSCNVRTSRWRYVRHLPVKDKFELAQEQVDNIKKNLEQLEYALSNKYEAETLIRATHVQGMAQSMVDTLKGEV